MISCNIEYHYSLNVFCIFFNHHFIFFINLASPTNVANTQDVERTEPPDNSKITLQRKTANPFKKRFFEMPEDKTTSSKLTITPSILNIQEIKDEPKISSATLISAVKCCEKNGVLKSCVQHCAVELEKGLIKVDTKDCSKFVPVISNCVGQEIVKMKNSGSISGKSTL